MARKKLEGIIWPNLPDDEYYLDAEKVEYNEEETYPEGSAGKAIQNKANTDGSYESMTVGNAEQLVSNVRVNDKTPYLFRTSGGSVDIGDREYVNGIVGGTVVWNQVYARHTSSSNTIDGVTITVDSDGYVNISGTATETDNTSIAVAPTIPANHVCLILCDGFKAGLTWGRVGFPITSKEYYMNKHTSAFSGGANIEITNGETVDYKVRFSTYDLTQTFGSTIADYIYSLETATAGAGVAWFKKLFPKPYYAYNAGELKSVSGLVSHDMVGFNALDVLKFEKGRVDNGVIGYESGTTSMTKTEKAVTFTTNANYRGVVSDKIKVVPNTPYTLSYVYLGDCGTYVDAYADDDTWIGLITHSFYRVIGTKRALVYPIPSNCAYIRVSFQKMTVGTTTIDEPCVHPTWDGSRDGEYEPYELHSYPLDSDLTLRGIPKLDANNNLYYDGDTYESDGTVTRKYGIVDLGTLTWEKVTTSGVTAFNSALSAKKFGAFNVICGKYPTIVTGQGWGTGNTPDKTVCGVSYERDIFIRDDAYTDATAFKTAMSGVYLVYELATPTTETADAYTSPQIVNDFGTEEYVLDDSEFPVPVGHDTDYPVNLVAKLEMAPNSPSGDGDYIVRQVDGENSYVPLVIEDALPTIPSTAGTYTLTVTVAEGSDLVLAWTQA